MGNTVKVQIRDKRIKIAGRLCALSYNFPFNSREAQILTEAAHKLRTLKYIKPEPNDQDTTDPDFYDRLGNQD